MISPTPSRQPASIRTAQRSYKDYVEQKKKDNEKPLSKDEWESKTQGKGKDKKKEPAKSEKSDEKKEPAKAEKDTTPVKLKKDLASLSSWATGGDAIQQVATHAQGGHPVPRHVVQKAKAMIESWLEYKDSYRIDAADEKELKKHLKNMEAILKTGAALARLEKLAARRPDLRSKVAAVLAQHGCDLEGPMMGRFEEGKPADPTENMSPEDAKEWWRQNEANKDNFKAANAVQRYTEALKRFKQFDSAVRKVNLNQAKRLFEQSVELSRDLEKQADKDWYADTDPKDVDYMVKLHKQIKDSLLSLSDISLSKSDDPQVKRLQKEVSVFLEFDAAAVYDLPHAMAYASSISMVASLVVMKAQSAKKSLDFYTQWLDFYKKNLREPSFEEEGSFLKSARYEEGADDWGSDEKRGEWNLILQQRRGQIYAFMKNPQGGGSGGNRYTSVKGAIAIELDHVRWNNPTINSQGKDKVWVVLRTYDDEARYYIPKKQWWVDVPLQMRSASSPVADDWKTARFEEGVPADPTENMSPEDAKEWWRQNEIHGDNFKQAAFGTIPDVGLLKNEAGQYLRIFPAKSMAAVQAMYTRYMNSHGHEVVTESSWIAAAKIFQSSDFLKDLQSPMDHFLFGKLPSTDMALVKRLRFAAMGQDKQARGHTTVVSGNRNHNSNAKIRLAFAGILSH